MFGKRDDMKQKKPASIAPPPTGASSSSTDGKSDDSVAEWVDAEIHDNGLARNEDILRQQAASPNVPDMLKPMTKSPAASPANGSLDRIAKAGGRSESSELEAESRQESGFFADYHNVRRGVSELRAVGGLQVDSRGWAEDLSTRDRLEIMQEAEKRLAGVQGRPPERVYGKDMGEREYGYFEPSGERRGIWVNTNPKFFNDKAETLNTVVHEGRHAYQQHALENPGFHPCQEDNKKWGHKYIKLKKNGSNVKDYATQSQERDAGAFGFAVTKGIFPDYEPSKDRIDRYNAENAKNKYGHLKLSADSQRRTPSDPARFGPRLQGGTSQPQTASPSQLRRGAETQTVSPGVPSTFLATQADGQVRTIQEPTMPGGGRTAQSVARQKPVRQGQANVSPVPGTAPASKTRAGGLEATADIEKPSLNSSATSAPSRASQKAPSAPKAQTPRHVGPKPRI